jgi:hypothetical protein
MRQRYPNCVACEYKAEFDMADRKLERAWRHYFMPTPLLQSQQYKNPSRWREEWNGAVIRIPLLYG